MSKILETPQKSNFQLVQPPISPTNCAICPTSHYVTVRGFFFFLTFTVIFAVTGRARVRFTVEGSGFN